MEVEEDERHRPAAITLRRQRLKVASVEDVWEIADEWWRSTPIARVYYRVLLEDGRAVTLFRDLVDGKWYRQRS